MNSEALTIPSLREPATLADAAGIVVVAAAPAGTDAVGSVFVAAQLICFGLAAAP